MFSLSLIKLSLKVNVYKEELANKLASESNKKTNPLDSLNFETEEFRGCVKRLADHLKIPPHPDDIVTLRAILVYVRSRLEQSSNDEKRKSSIFKLEEIPAGTKCEIKEIVDAVKLMRLLYINNLRDLQTSINQILVNVQSITGESFLLVLFCVISFLNGLLILFSLANS